jgi:hypothetical protein
MALRMTAAASAVVAILTLTGTGTAAAATLNDESLATGIALSAGFPAPNPGAITVYNSLPVTDTYGNAFTCSACASKVLVTDAGSSFNFYDDYVFTVGPATIDAVSSTISLGKSLSLDNLEMRLYTSDGSSVPVLGNSPPGLKSGNPTNGGWSAPIDFSAGSQSGQISVLNDVMLSSGTYVLEVRGDVTGTSGGSYSGTLNLTPVPVPAALPLLVSGLGLLGGLVRKRVAR